MNILVIGGTGFLSGRLVDLLARAGHRVTTLTRNGMRGVRAGIEQLCADRRDPSAVAVAVGHRMFDAVFDMIAYERADSEHAARLFTGRVGRFIHCSTVSVYMISNDVRCPITEDQDGARLMPFFARNPFGMQYGMDKRACEQALWKAHHPTDFPVSMVRPTYIGGPGDPARRDWFWIQRILDGGPLLVPGSGDHAFQSVFADDVARAFAALLEHPESIGKAYNIAGDEIFSLNDYLHRLGGLLNRLPTLVHLPQTVFDELPFSSSPEGDVFTFNVRRTAIFSLDRIKCDLGFRSTPFDEWMRRTAESFISAGRDSNGYHRRQEEVDVITKWRKNRIDHTEMRP